MNGRVVNDETTDRVRRAEAAVKPLTSSRATHTGNHHSSSELL